MEPNIKFNRKDNDSYPFVNNVNPFNTETEFNYSLWSPNSTITLTHVPWTNDYKDVVKFDTDQDRDIWFSQQVSHSQVIENAVRVPRNGVISLPITFNNIVNFNYLIAEYPLPPGKITNEKTKTKYFYFVNDIIYKNASVSELVIQLDVWTTFINNIEIGNTMLERGHAPMLMTNVDDYLSCPLLNNDGLLSPDIYFEDTSIVKHEEFIPFRKGQQYVLIATSGSTGRSWENDTTCIGPNVNGNVPNNIRVFAIKSSDYIDFMNTINTNIPQFIQTIKAIFYLDESFLTFNGEYQFQGFTLYNVLERKHNLADIQLTKEMFGYDKKYSWITKLYTSPYSVIEIYDNIGKVATINIEDISKLGVKAMSSLAFPFINIRAFISGINGQGENEYLIKTFDSETNVKLGKDDWQKYIFDIDIPTYGIYQKNEDNYMYNSKFDRIQEQNNIDNSFLISNKNANVTYQNSSILNNQDKNFESEKLLVEEQKLDNNISVMKEIQEVKQDINWYKYNSNIAQNYLASELKEGNTMFNTMTSIANQTVGMMIASGVSGVAAGPLSAVPLGITLASGIYHGDNASELYDIFWQNTKVINALESVYDMYINGNNSDTLRVLTNPKDDSTYEYGGGEQDGIVNTNALNNFNLSKNLSNSHINIKYNNNNTILSNSLNNQLENNLSIKQNSEEGIQNTIKQQKLRNNIEFGNYSGNSSFLDTENMRGLDIKVKTQKKDIVDKTASIFLRYGYSYESDYDVTDLNLMTHFTFWKFNEIWIRSKEVYEGALAELRNIFIRGVTVWREPSDIGFVKITDNKPL